MPETAADNKSSHIYF